MELYINDIITKLVFPRGYTRHLKDIFNVLRKHQMCLTLKTVHLELNQRSFLDLWCSNGESKLPQKNPSNP